MHITCTLAGPDFTLHLLSREPFFLHRAGHVSLRIFTNIYDALLYHVKCEKLIIKNYVNTINTNLT